MKKKQVIVIVAGLILAAAPAVASSIFTSTINRCGDPSSATACATNPAASDPLNSGSVTITDGGEVHVQLWGAAANTTYTVFVGVFAGSAYIPAIAGVGICVPNDGTIGTVITDAAGDFSGTVTMPDGARFAVPPGTSINQVNFVFNNPQCTRTQFTTGIAVP